MRSAAREGLLLRGGATTTPRFSCLSTADLRYRYTYSYSSYRVSAGSQPDEPEPDHYTVLGVPRGATSAQIKRAYRLLALKHHPDVTRRPGPAHAFLSILAAYQLLSDEHKRAQYDVRTQSSTKTHGSSTAFWTQDIYRYPDPISYYRMRYSKQTTSPSPSYTAPAKQKATLDDQHNRGTFVDVLRFSFLALLLVKLVGPFVTLTLCALLALVDDELDNGYKLGYLVSWFLGGRPGVILMLFIRFASWLSGKDNSGLLMLLVLALWLGVGLARFVPLPQGTLLALLYMSIKLHHDFK